ncbi:MAG: GPI transamidase component [Piccolia ochrophora]|nr:MAG: GPI transamidase component [Piccolia ochrophora]
MSDPTLDPSSVPVAVTKAKSQPPPERPENVRTRSLIILSFWAVVVLLGLPIWWKTTTIYRAKLPLQEMMDWADGRACRPVFPLQISVEAPELQEQEAQHLLQLTQHALDDLNDFTAHHLRLHLSHSKRNESSPEAATDPSLQTASAPVPPDTEADVAMVLRLVPGETGSSPSISLQALSPRLDVAYPPNQIPSSSSTSSTLAAFIAGTLRDMFAEEQAMMAHILSPTASGSGNVPPSNSIAAPQMPQPSGQSASGGWEVRTPSRSLPSDLAANLARRTTRSVKYAPTYHLTFSLFTPSATPSSWEIESALEQNIIPLLESLSVISNFTVDTQVQVYATFSPSIRQPQYDAEIGSWTLSKEDLSGFINAAEWPLSPSIGGAPTVNFILYVPAKETAPLVIKENQGNSWLIPQWGGVFILNSPHDPTAQTPDILSIESLRNPLRTFSHQLLSLLGTPQSPPSLPLRLSTLTRVRSASLLFSASSTLGSLARLTLALQSISIPRSVANAVDKTIAHLHNACADLREGQFHKALQNGRIAEAEAERGFFEKSMVGQVYFPDEHKVAVYLPLLGPVGVPLVIGLLKEVRRMLKDWKRRRAGGV